MRWPDGTDAAYYSPSTIIARHFASGDAHPTAHFLTVAASAFREASRRVELRYGSPCPRAAASLRRIEQDAAAQAEAGDVRVLEVLLEGGS